MGEHKKGFTRRQILAGSGAALASATLVSPGCAREEASFKWDHEKISNEASKRNFRIMKYLEYKSYTGSIEYSSEDNLLYGKVVN